MTEEAITPSDDAAAGGNRRREWITMGAILVVMGVVMTVVRRPGHWWGDDWALYIRQADALVHGTVRRVADANAFTVSMSQGAPFSPPIYPWGYPIMLAPFVAVLGIDVDALAIVTVLSALAAGVGWYLLARRRLGMVPAMVGMVAVTWSPLLFTWVELIQSELPFLGVTMLALAGLDRVAQRHALFGSRARWWVLALVGVGVAASFSVRREGLGMVAALGAAQLSALVATQAWRRYRGPARWRVIAQLATPFGSALGVVLAIQVLLPTTVVPRYSGTSIANTWRFGVKHLSHLAQLIGLRKPWAPEPAIFGAPGLGWMAFGVIFAFALVGMGLAFRINRTRDLHLVAYGVVAFAIGGSFMYANHRYVVTVAPLVTLLSLSALWWTIDQLSHRRAATVAVVAALIPIVASNGWFAWQRLETTRELAADGTIEWGPTHPDAIAMFEAVEELTPPRAVVGAPKARAMGLMTGRPTVQVDQYRPIPTEITVAYVVAELSSPVPSTLTDAGYDLIWSNMRFGLWQLADD
ncbi:MAG: hypothetical protein CSA55_03070 [Ilumatobacter coccineus]|uniref:Glycosyltransferase RgtA/B/C/D-like domain-containing protein n=1 Tax=Ilumatobacter coccineus TaxID=467094 RepID=A0A2G6KAG9_9ACTN|nr:MAG: hypothetical protein CSA55_03070 [Ilumatobacter coccineus]